MKISSLFLFVFYVSLYLLFCHELVVHILRKRIILHLLLLILALSYATLDYYVCMS